MEQLLVLLPCCPIGLAPLAFQRQSLRRQGLHLLRLLRLNGTQVGQLGAGVRHLRSHLLSLGVALCLPALPAGSVAGEQTFHVLELGQRPTGGLLLRRQGGVLGGQFCQGLAQGLSLGLQAGQGFVLGGLLGGQTLGLGLELGDGVLQRFQLFVQLVAALGELGELRLGGGLLLVQAVQDSLLPFPGTLVLEHLRLYGTPILLGVLQLYLTLPSGTGGGF